MAKITKLAFDIIECEAGWQVECAIGDFTCYSPVKRTVDDVKKLAEQFAKSILRHAMFTNEPTPNPEGWMRR